MANPKKYILPSLKEAQKRTQQQVMIERALFELPAAGYTISKRLSETSRYMLTPSFTAKGHTPPTA